MQCGKFNCFCNNKNHQSGIPLEMELILKIVPLDPNSDLRLQGWHLHFLSNWNKNVRTNSHFNYLSKVPYLQVKLMLFGFFIFLTDELNIDSKSLTVKLRVSDNFFYSDVVIRPEFILNRVSWTHNFQGGNKNTLTNNKLFIPSEKKSFRR